MSSAEQPLPDVLLISFRNAANVRNWPPQSAPMDESLQQLLRGDFGPSVIKVSSMEGKDPTSRDSIFDNFDTITITFNQDTNKGHDMPLNGITKDQIDKLFIFSQSLGSDYRAKWDSARAITIQVVNASGSAPPSIGGLWVGLRPEGNLRNLPASCAPSNANYPSVKLAGDFGPSNIFITDFFAEDPDNLDNEFSSGDSLLVTFSQRTNQGGLPGLMNKQQLDSLLAFTHPIGANYTGQWSSDSTKIYIYIYDATGGAPQLFVSTASVKDSGNLRNWPAACQPSTSTSMALRGDLGRTIPYITSIVAKDPFGKDQIYGFLDIITISFSEPTDRAGFELNARIPQGTINLMLSFTHKMGSIAAKWVTDSKIILTVEGTVGATPPSIGNLNISCKGQIQIPFVAPQGYVFDPVFRPIMKRTGSKACFRTSPPLQGDFGPSAMSIDYLLAVSSPVPDSKYGNQDSIKVKFNQDTSMGGKKIGQLLDKKDVDQMIDFPFSIGNYYVGKWETLQIFTIIIWDARDAFNPILGDFSITINASGNIRNNPPQSTPNEARSPTLTVRP